MKNCLKMCFIFLGVVLSIIPSLAQEIDESTAQQRALSFLKRSHISMTRSISGNASFLSVKLAHTSVGEIGNNYYAYNVGDNDGFIVISADNRTEEVLCYADEGSFDIDDMPPSMKCWIGEYEKQIQLAKRKNITKPTNTEDKVQYRIKPLLSTKWGQLSPYNNLTPLMDSFNHYPSGCIATAMAQIMNYHKYPAKGTSSIQYEWKNTKNEMEILSVDFSKNVYKWDMMLNDYSTNNYIMSGSSQAVAELMRDCGYAVKMNYDTNGSGATSDNIPSALCDFFSFDKHTQNIARRDYSSDSWNQIIYNELDNNRPVIICAEAITLYDIDAHAFVCDGYQDGYFHFNFGYNGQADGYFKLDAIQANYIDESIGYNSNQIATLCYVRNIDNAFSPEKYGTVVQTSYALSITDIQVPDYAYLNNYVSIAVQLKNSGTKEYHGAIALQQIINENPLITEIKAIKNVSINASETLNISFDPHSEEMLTISGSNFVIVDMLDKSFIGDKFVINTKESPGTLLIDGLYYRLVNDADEAFVTYQENAAPYTGDVVIPSAITFEGKMVPVTTVGANAFSYFYSNNLTSITMPQSIKQIQAGAFATWESVKIKVDAEEPPSMYPDATFVINKELHVPKGCAAKYNSSIGWKDFSKIYEDNELTLTNVKIEILRHGGGTVEIEGYESNSAIVQANQEITINITPKKYNDIIIVQDLTKNGLNITKYIKNNKLSINPNQNTTLAVFFGFKMDGLYYSVVSDDEVVILCPSMYTGIGIGSPIGDVTIPESIIKDDKEYKVGGIEVLTFNNITSINVPWEEPIDVLTDVFCEDVFANARLIVPKGSSDKYINHNVWGKFSHVYEGNTPIKDNVLVNIYCSATIDSLYINGVNYTHQRFCSINKGTDLEVRFSLLPLSSLVSCTVNGNDVLQEVYNNTLTISNVQSNITLSCKSAMYKDGVWYETHLGTISKQIYTDENGIDHEIKKEYLFGEINITTGLYEGDVVIPEIVTISETNIDGKIVVLEKSAVNTTLDVLLDGSVCDNLHSVDLPKTISRIERRVLHDSHYKYLIVRWEQPLDISTDVFYDNTIWDDRSIFKNATLMVPVGSLDAYKQHSVWGLFENIIEGDDWRAYEQGFPLGDTNFDKKVTEIDYESVASQIVAMDKPRKFNTTQADVNSDGEIDVADYVQVANIILHNVPQQSMNAGGERWNDAVITVSMSDKNTLSLNVNNTGEFSAFQFDMELPNSISVAHVTKAFASKGHTVTWANQGNNKYRFLCGSIDNAAINDSNLLNMNLDIANNFDDGEIKVCNIRLVQSDGTVYVLKDELVAFSLLMTTIEKMNKEMSNLSVYDLQGRKIANSRKSAENLPAGVYLSNHQLFIVK